MATDLRAAAASARAFAETMESPELRQSFRAMARRWEAEAESCEKRAGARAARYHASWMPRRQKK